MIDQTWVNGPQALGFLGLSLGLFTHIRAITVKTCPDRATNVLYRTIHGM